MNIRWCGILIFSMFSHVAYCLDLKLNSVRVSLSKPQTFHSLIYAPELVGDTKINFELEPINNERVGVFVDLNGVEIGYAVDFIDDERQTETEDFIFSYKSLRHSRITLNYQTLEGFDTNALNLQNEPQAESIFLAKTKSTKVELFGLHDFYTFTGESLFEHFFLNRPKLSQSTDVGLSLVGSWSYKRLSLESDDNLIFTPNYLNENVQTINKITAQSFDFAAGPLLSVSLQNNVHLFAELKAGKGYFKNLNEDNQLKRSGNETIYALGSGASWTSSSEKTLFLLRAWLKQGRHVETFFGDASVIYFF
jgi:hypothetical protein